MMNRRLGGLFLAVVLWTGTATATEEVPPHDKAFWEAILHAEYVVPEGQSPFALAQELSGMLGSPDPELRDRIAFSILNAWISGDVPFAEPELVALLDEWRANLRVSDNGGVLKRSFSALCLAALVERELKTPFLGDERYRELLDAALRYLAAESDLRGFDADEGWVHATAHTADLLAVLARHQLFTPADQKRMLVGVAERLSSAPEVYTQGEQDRLAQAVTALVLRSDFDAAGFEEWLTGVRAARRQAARTRPMTATALAKVQNVNYFLQALYARLSMESLPAGAVRSRVAVLGALR